MRTFPLIACSCMTQQMHKWSFLLARLDDLVSEWRASVSTTAVESRTNAVLMAAQEDRKQTTPQKQTRVWSVYKRGVIQTCSHQMSALKFADFVHLFYISASVWSKKDKCMWKETVHFNACKIRFNQFYFHTGAVAPALLIGLHPESVPQLQGPSSHPQ